MALQNRRGEEVWFDASKMLPGEFAVSTDKRRLRICFAPGDVREIAFKDEIPIAGDITPDKLQEAVDNYLGDNPVQPGASEEQANQIERNRQNIEEMATSDTKDNVVTFTSDDAETSTEWKDVAVLTSGEKHSSLLAKVSTMFKNMRYFKKAIAENANAITQLSGNKIDKTSFPTCFIRMYSHGHTSETPIDANYPYAMIMSGWGGTNLPTPDGVVLVTLPYSNALQYCVQLCFHVQTLNGTKWVRKCNENDWGDWHTF